MSNNALIPDPSNHPGVVVDYKLNPEHGSAWIEIGSIEVHVMRTDEGVVVVLYAKGMAMETDMASCYAFEKEAQQMIEEAKEQK